MLFLYLLVCGGIAVGAYLLDENASNKETAFRDRYGNTFTIWTFVMYFALLFFAIGLCALFNI